MRIHGSSHTKIETLDTTNEQNQQEQSFFPARDSFEKNENLAQGLVHRAIAKHVRKINNKYEPKPIKAPRGGPLAMCAEEKFLYNPTTRSYLRLVKAFDDVMLDCNQAKFKNMEKFLITPGDFRNSLGPWMNDMNLLEREQKLEDWNEKHAIKHQEEITKSEKQVEKREHKILEKGLGFGGHMTSMVGNNKARSFYMKNHMTIRGQVFALNNDLFGKSIYEILPRYGSRRKQHMAVRITQFGINAIITAVGYGLVPVTFGISTIVTSHAQTLVTLSGEVFALKLDGAKSEKIASHAALRGVQLEIPKFVPFVGTAVNYGENIMMGTAAAGIVSTTLADMILQSASDRYASTLNTDDLGNPAVLIEMNERIDYLSRFLLPTGQHLLMKEQNPALQKTLRAMLKTHFRTLVSLEHKRTKALNFYQLALVADKIPGTHIELIKEACMREVPQSHTNTHKVVRRCLATLLATPPRSAAQT
jgi:hypothetical protein